MNEKKQIEKIKIELKLKKIFPFKMNIYVTTFSNSLEDNTIKYIQHNLNKKIENFSLSISNIQKEIDTLFSKIKTIEPIKVDSIKFESVDKKDNEYKLPSSLSKKKYPISKYPINFAYYYNKVKADEHKYTKDKTKYTITMASKDLGISRETFYKYMRRYEKEILGLELPTKRKKTEKYKYPSNFEYYYNKIKEDSSKNYKDPTKYTIKKASKEIGVSRDTFYRYIRYYEKEVLGIRK